MRNAMTVCFLGPDGSGKSTIIDGLLKADLPFAQHNYFHLKPFSQKDSAEKKVVTDPHKYKPYSVLKSYGKLLFFVYQYNKGWVSNILPLKSKSSLVIFDRYYDDILVDYKRYRYGGSRRLAKFIRYFIPKPEVYFVLITDANIIHKRKQEVSLEELERQINDYRSLVDGQRYISIDVSKAPKEIVSEISSIILNKIDGRD